MAVCIEDKNVDMLSALFMNCLLIYHLPQEECDNNTVWLTVSVAAVERLKRVLGVTLFIEINSLKLKYV